MLLFAREFFTMRMAFEEFGRPPYLTDVNALIDECRNLYPGLMNMEQYLISRGFDTIRL